jgi:hypothetical protein
MDGRTLTEVGKRFNLTIERVRQIEARAIRAARRCAELNLIKDPADDEIIEDVIDDRIRATDHLVLAGDAERETRNMLQATKAIGRHKYTGRGWTAKQAEMLSNYHQSRLSVVPEISFDNFR